MSRVREQDLYRNCRIQMTKEAFKRCIQRKFPMSELRKMVLGGRWCPHVKENRRTCVYRDKEKNIYWTIIIAPRKKYIFIITVYKSNYHEIRMFKKVGK